MTEPNVRRGWSHKLVWKYAGRFSLIVPVVIFLLIASTYWKTPPVQQSEAERVVIALPAPEPQLTQSEAAESPELLGQDSPPPSVASQTGGGFPEDVFPSVDEFSAFVPANLALPAKDIAPTTARTSSTSPSQLTETRGRSDRIPFAADIGKFVSEEQARLQSKGPVADPVTISLFGGQPVKGRSFLLLIDRSKSMARHGLAALQGAKEQLILALRPLQATHKFQVVAYNDECAFLGARELLPATEENKQAIRGFLDELVAVGATEHEMGLRIALSKGPDVIYLLTDGGDPELSEAQIRLITKLAGERTSIHCIHLGFGAQEEKDNSLKRLATMNRGTYQYIDVSRNW